MNVFLDANIVLDLIDTNRGKVISTKNAFVKLISESYELYTSCDIFTTVYYVASKTIQYQLILAELEKILQIVNIVPIDINIINETMDIAKNEESDLEDVLQYVCAKSVKCSLIVTNDKKFFTKDIPTKSSQEI